MATGFSMYWGNLSLDRTIRSNFNIALALSQKVFVDQLPFIYFLQHLILEY